MAMKLELTNRAKVLAGVVALAGAGAAAWFLYLEDWLAGPPPAPAAASAPKPPAPTPANAAAAKPVPAPAVAAAEPAKPAVVEPPKPAVVAIPKPAPVETPKKAAVQVAAVKPAPAPSPAPEEKPRAAEPAPAPVAALPPAPEARGRTPGPKYNDLMTAVLNRDAAGVNELIAFGRWPDKPDSQGVTPLMAAAMLGDTTNAEALLKAGANPDAAVRIARERRDSAMTALLERYATSKRP